VRRKEFGSAGVQGEEPGGGSVGRKTRRWLPLGVIAPVLSRSVALVLSKARNLLSAIVGKPKKFYGQGSDGMVCE
jgi:hypothetical protein